MLNDVELAIEELDEIYKRTKRINDADALELALALEKRWNELSIANRGTTARIYKEIAATLSKHNRYRVNNFAFIINQALRNAKVCYCCCCFSIFFAIFSSFTLL